MFKKQFTQINILRGEPFRKSSEHMSFLIFDHHLSKKLPGNQHRYKH